MQVTHMNFWNLLQLPSWLKRRLLNAIQKREESQEQLKDTGVTAEEARLQWDRQKEAQCRPLQGQKTEFDHHINSLKDFTWDLLAASKTLAVPFVASLIQRKGDIVSLTTSWDDVIERLDQEKRKRCPSEAQITTLKEKKEELETKIKSLRSSVEKDTARLVDTGHASNQILHQAADNPVANGRLQAVALRARLAAYATMKRMESERLNRAVFRAKTGESDAYFDQLYEAVP